jgi:hypothetical protein
MQRWFGASALTGLAVWLGATAIQARVAFIPPPPAAVQVGQAEIVVVGRVVGHEPKDIEVPVAPGAKETQKFRVAVVKVAEPIVGAKDVKTLRVGFMPRGEENPGRPIRVFPGQNPNLDVGFNGLFILARQPGAKDLFVADGPYTVRPLGEDGSANPDVKAFRQLAKLVADPMAGMQSKNADDRFQTAMMMIYRYRSFRGAGQPKEEPISVEESKLILNGLADGDWTLQGRAALTPAFQTFLQLGVTEKDGLVLKGANAEGLKAAQEWCRKNAGTFRIRRFVAGSGTEAAPGAGGRSH